MRYTKQQMEALEREAHLLVRAHIDMRLAERKQPPPKPGVAQLDHEIEFCHTIMRNQHMMKIELIRCVEPDFMRSPATRRLWSAMLFTHALGEGCGVAALYTHDRVAFLLSEQLTPMRWIDKRIEELAFLICGSGVEQGFFDEVIEENGPPQE
jgi:hypothetical protein